MHEAISRGYRAVEVLHHGFLTGLILTTVSRRSGADAAELVFRTFRRQHLEKFLPGLAKLGLSALPHAWPAPSTTTARTTWAACASSTCTSPTGRRGCATCRPAGSPRARRSVACRATSRVPCCG